MYDLMIIHDFRPEALDTKTRRPTFLLIVYLTKHEYSIKPREIQTLIFRNARIFEIKCGHNAFRV